MIEFSDFKQLDLRVGRIEEVEPVEGADRLLKLQVDIGSEERQIVAGLAQTHTPEELKGKKTIFLVNLEPKEIMGTESQGMLLAGRSEDGEAVVFTPEEDIPVGSEIN